MIVCICNRLTDVMIAKAVADGARNQADVLRRYRMHRGCSACSVKIAECIDRALKSPAAEAAE